MYTDRTEDSPNRSISFGQTRWLVTPCDVMVAANEGSFILDLPQGNLYSFNIGSTKIHYQPHNTSLTEYNKTLHPSKFLSTKQHDFLRYFP